MPRRAWATSAAANLLDGGAPFYGVYETADGKYVAVGAIEPQFYAALLAGLGLETSGLPDPLDREKWPTLREPITARFRMRTLEAWAPVFDGVDACVTPVLSFAEARGHPHVAARELAFDLDGIPQLAPYRRRAASSRGDRPRRRDSADFNAALAA